MRNKVAKKFRKQAMKLVTNYDNAPKQVDKFGNKIKTLMHPVGTYRRVYKTLKKAYKQVISKKHLKSVI
jgi:ribonuclease D